jgi:hypothetical protein
MEGVAVRSEFGSWGLDLDDDEFGKALAVAGIIGSEYWSENLDDITERLINRFRPRSDANYGKPSIWRKPQGVSSTPPGSTLARAWDRFRDQSKERFQARLWDPDTQGFRDLPVRLFAMVSPHTDGIAVASYLTRSSLGSVALHFADRWMSADADWRWPLRVGYAPGAGTVSLNAFRDHPWVDSLHIGFDVSPTAEFCDVLIVTDPPWEFLPKLASGEVRVDANCVVFLGSVVESWARTVPLVEAVGTYCHASGVGFVNVAPTEFGGFFVELIRYLSHDEPIDLALASAARKHGNPPPLLWAHPILARVASTRQRAAILARMTEIYRAPVEPIDIREDAGGRLAAADIEELKAVASQLEFVWPSIEFVRESGRASDVAAAAPRAEALVAEASLTENTHTRRILAGVYAVVDGEPRLTPGGFAIDLPSIVRVAIGSLIEGWGAAEDRFPDDILPLSEEPHRLTVVLSVPDLVPEPLVATIVLPRTGPSSTCEFALGVVPPDRESVRARISVLFRNRILQTAILSAPVVRGLGQAEDSPQMISIDVEAPVRPGLADLGERRRFDAAMLFNHTEAGDSGVQSFAGRRNDLNIDPRIDAEVGAINRLISRVATDPQKYEAIDSPESRALIIGLARHGTLLRDGLFLAPWLDIMRRAKRIQLVSVDPSVLVPVELVYDRSSPADDAVLCPNWATRATKDPASSEGRCGDDCPPGPGVVCPLSFWCTSKVVERAAVDGTGPPPDLVRDVRFETEPTTTRRELPLFGSALLGASSKVDTFLEGATKGVFDSLGQATDGHAGNVATWNDWTSSITSLDPALLLLLPHTAQDNALIETIEIGQDAVGVDRLDIPHVRNQAKELAPLVILLGCSTAVPSLPFQSFVIKFRSLGASVVIGTMATILGRHASPAAKALIAAIRTSADQPGGATLGEVVRDARRTLLSNGVVMALALTAYGDADWRLVPAGP